MKEGLNSKPCYQQLSSLLGIFSFLILENNSPLNVFSIFFFHVASTPELELEQISDDFSWQVIPVLVTNN